MTAATVLAALTWAITAPLFGTSDATLTAVAMWVLTYLLVAWLTQRRHQHAAGVVAVNTNSGEPTNRTTAGIFAAAFLACILAANHVTTEYGMVPVGFGLVATAGTYFAGLTFVLRDSVQDAYGKAATLGLIALGAGLSYLIADPFIALASGVAFLASELADLAIYTPLRRRGYIRAAVASNVVGAFVDTVLFLWIAGFPIADAIAGQMVGKVAITALVVTLVAVYRTRRAVTE